MQGATIEGTVVKDTPNNTNDSDQDNSVGVGVYYPSGNVTIRDCEITNTGYRGIESSGSDVTVKDLETEDIRERHISPSALRFDGRLTQNMTIENVTMRKGNGSDVGSHISAHGSDYAGSTFQNPQGEALTNITIEKVRCYGPKRAGLSLRQLGAGDGPIHIENVWIEDAANDGIAITDGPDYRTANPDVAQEIDVSVEDITIETADARGINIDTIDGVSVEDATVNNSGAEGIAVDGCPNATVSKCVVKNASVGVYANSASVTTIQSCTTITTEESGIRASFGDDTGEDVTIANCTVKAPNQGSFRAFGIDANATRTKIVGCTIRAGPNTDIGISFGGDEYLADGNIIKGYASSATSERVNGISGTVGANET